MRLKSSRLFTPVLGALLAYGRIDLGATAPDTRAPTVAITSPAANSP